MQLDTFKRVCDGLKLSWREVLDSESDVEIGQSEETEHPEVVEMSATAATSETVGTTLAIARRQVTVLDHQKAVKARIVLEGDIDSVDANFKSTLEVLLKCYGGDTIEIIDIQAGSIRITIQGSEQDIERLRAHIASGELTQVDDSPIEDLMILGDASLESLENPRLQTKWELIQAIKAQPQPYRQLREIDLSDADLRGAVLNGADLRKADLWGTDLSEADLSEANLWGAILRRADLWGADLHEAVLREADLRGTVLWGADLCRSDLSEADLRGAVLWGAALCRSDLSEADLRVAILREADLREVDLRRADLREAILWNADLRGADLHGAIVQHARFGEGIGLSQNEKQDLTLRGAIFSDTSGDREAAYSPINR